MTGGSRGTRALRHAASAWRSRHAALPRWSRTASVACCAAGVAIATACYDTGDGTAPPPNTFYFPVGLAVSAAGNVLYAVNSDFDLQYNGGTVQSYDLTRLRNDTVRLILGVYAGGPNLPGSGLDAGIDAALPWSSGAPPTAACPDTSQSPPPTDPNNPNAFNGGPARLPIGEACAPPIDSQVYVRDSVTIGAFPTDVIFSKFKDRLFIPVRGDGTLTWIDLTNDSEAFAAGAKPTDTKLSYAPFFLGCRRDAESRCTQHAGSTNDPGNTRRVNMPGEPFGIALSDDGTAVAVTHQTDTETSLFLSGLDPRAQTIVDDLQSARAPSIQFLVGGLPTGGIAVVSVPHDPLAVPVDPANPSPVPLRPAFLQTSAAVPELDLLRYYKDEGYQGLPATDAGGNPVVQAEAGVVVGSSNERPFLVRERIFPLAVNAGGTNSRGIVIDDTPRRACKATLTSQGVPASDPRFVACAQLSARIYLANRSPASLVLGQVGGFQAGGNVYDPDQVSLFGNVPLAAGPSNVYLAPIVDANGNYALRVFIVCFDSQVIVVWDPDAQRIENVIRTGPGPFAMAFDPFDLDDVATRAPVPFDARSELTIKGGALDGKQALRKYRFAYIASFTDSFVQVLDLDQSFQGDARLAGDSTFETVVFTLGLPTLPKGAR